MDLVTGLFPFRSPLLRKSQLISFPLVTKMFQFSRFASTTLYIQMEILCLCKVSFLIRKSPDKRLLAPNRGLSQLTTSFIVSMYLGIPRTPLVTLSKLFLRITRLPTSSPNCQKTKNFVELAGIEPTTPWLQTRCSPN